MNEVKNFIKKTPIYTIYKYINNWKNIILLKYGNRALILLYHRVENTNNDPLLLCVNIKNFEDQMKFLKQNFKPISLETLISKIKNKKDISKNIVITFDDGYSDNLYQALPILKKLDIPATIFVTANHVKNQEKFHWDYNNNESGRSLNIEELNKLASDKLIEIGAHTLSHPHLHKITREEQKEEILGSKEIIEKIIGKKIKGFAYPFGTKEDCNLQTINIVRSGGFEYACSNIKGLVNHKSNIYSLPRCLVRNWNILEFKKNI